MITRAGAFTQVEERRPNEGPRPLTKRQELIWLERELANGAPANVMVALFEIGGAIDPERFADAFEALVRETEALRTILEPGPAQRVLSEIPYRPAFVDLRDRADPRAALLDWCRDHASAPTDPSRRLFDAALIALADDRFAVHLRQHHLITDAWSHGLLWRRLGELYERRPGAATRPFSEQLERERAYLASSAHADDARFWAARLEDPPPTPSFYGRALRQRSGLVRREIVRLGAERTARVIGAAPRAIGRHRVYATALFALLARITDQRRFAIGSPLANRGSKRQSQIVGLVMQPCPILCEVPLGATFAELGASIGKELREVLSHARFCTHNPSGERLYDASINVHTVKYASFAGFPVTASIAPALALASRWPDGAQGGAEALAVTAFEDGGEVLAFDLNREAFGDDRVIAHYLAMLDALLSDPNARLDDVDLLSDEDRAVCLAPVPRPATSSALATIAQQIARTPDRPAVGCAARTITFRDLARRAGGIARALRDRGVRHGDAVAIALGRSELLPAALLGTMSCGAAYVPLDPDHPRERIARVVEDAKPVVLLTEPSIAIDLDLPRVDATSAGEDDLVLDSIGVDDLAYVMFTSGSTGRPKGVEITHGALASFLAAFAHTPGMCAGDRVIAITTPTFDIHVVELLLPLYTGAFTYIAPPRTNADGAQLAKMISDVGATIVQATPPTWRALVTAGWRGDPNLTALCGGEPLPPDLAQALLGRTGALYNVYGPTEATVWTSAERVESPDAIAVGRSIGHTSARVLDARRKPVPIGVEGEIYIAGPGLARGYRGRPELTAEAFVLVDGERLYRTGDRGRFREDGALECRGRHDGQVKVRGHRVELGEIEVVLRDLEGVDDAAVIFAGDRLVAHVAGRADVAALRAHAASRLPSHMVPDRWQVLDALPIGPTGKIDRRALTDHGIAAVSSVAPRDDTEAALAALFAEALDLPSVGVTDDFFDLGGHSLLAARLVERIRAMFHVELSIGALFEARTIAALAERVHRGAAPVPGCIALTRGSAAVPLFCVCGVHVYHALASRLARPVYGVYLPVEEEVVHDARAGRTTELSVDRMARAYTEVIREHQPKGPYALAGLSFGGLLAYEVAQQLRAIGEEVAVLALFDTILPSSLKRDPLPWLAAQARSFARAPSERVHKFFAHEQPPAADDATAAIIREAAYVAAMRRYRPRPYDGEVLLFRATDSSFGEGWRFPRDGGLSAFAPRLRMLEVPGSHTGVLKPPHVDVLASKLASFLARLG